MTSSTGRPSSPPLALTSSRQISSAVLITLLGAAPAPVSARLIPTLMGLPVCADAPEREKNPMMKAATNACSAVPHIFAMVSSRMRNVGAPASHGAVLFVHFVTWHDAPVVG